MGIWNAGGRKSPLDCMQTCLLLREIETPTISAVTGVVADGDEIVTAIRYLSSPFNLRIRREIYGCRYRVRL